MRNLFFPLTWTFAFSGLVLEFGLNSLFCSFSGLDSGLDVCFLVWIFDMGFWFSILELDFESDFDWIFSGFWLKGRRVWTMLGKGPKRPGFGLGLRPYIIGYLSLIHI